MTGTHTVNVNVAPEAPEAPEAAAVIVENPQLGPDLDFSAYFVLQPELLYKGPTVDKILDISKVTRWRLTQRGLLPARRPLGPGTMPRYLGADVLKLRDAT